MPSKFLTKRVVLAIHRDLIETFGGSSGLRDEGLLDSALAQPRSTGSGQLLHRTVFEQAAAYLFHLSGNHPFLDGNKRIAFAAADVFLRINGYRLTMSDQGAYELSVAAAQGTLSKKQIATALRKHASRL